MRTMPGSMTETLRVRADEVKDGDKCGDWRLFPFASPPGVALFRIKRRIPGDALAYEVRQWWVRPDEELVVERTTDA